KRRVISTSSGFGASERSATRGSSAIPQIGQAPGRSLTTSGCIGQVYSTGAWCLVAGAGCCARCGVLGAGAGCGVPGAGATCAFLSPPIETTCGCIGSRGPARYFCGSAENFVMQPVEQK